MTQLALTATVSGSFRRAMGAVQEAVYCLTDAGVRVLSPADPRVVDQFGDFLFVASDRVRALKLVQSRHLAAIKASDFVWLEAPEGYVGQSGAMEIGYAVSVDTPVFSSELPTDLTLRQYVTPLSSPLEAIRAVKGRNTPAAASNVLLDPVNAIRSAHEDLDRIGKELLAPATRDSAEINGAANRLHTRITRPLNSW